MPTRGRDPCSRFLATSLPLWSRVMQRKQRRFASIWALYPNEGCEARNSNHAESRLRCGAQLSQGSAGEGILDENPFVALSVLHLAEDGAASGSTRRPHDQRIPEGQLVKAMQIDRSQDQFSRHLDHVRLRVRRHMLLHRSEGPLLERTTMKWTALCPPPGPSIGATNAPRRCPSADARS